MMELRASHGRERQQSWRLRAVLGAGVLAIVLGGCRAQPARFESPQAAADSLVAALDPEFDRSALKEIFGSNADEIISSGDDVDDRENGARFVEDYRSRHAFESNEDGSTSLVIGPEDWPFAIPLSESDGQWYFDTDAGHDELLNRRIGRNELDTIQTCLATADAQLEYAMLDPDGDGVRAYASRFLSSPGQRDGLYWPTDGTEEPSPFGDLVAGASASGYQRQAGQKQGDGVYRGYRFRILTAQGSAASGGARDYLIDGDLIGGFAVVAWPATYANSGVMTFLVSHEGIVYEADLGRRTDRTVRRMTRFNPDARWKQLNQTPFDLQ